MAVVVRMQEATRLIGASGKDYGMVQQGVVLPMLLADMQADVRVAKATQETLRLARLK
jgi:hypothetical protein